MTPEGIIQDAFAKWLRDNRIYFIQARRDAKSTIRKGHPDFTLIHCNRCLLIEMKTEKGSLSPDQKAVIETLRKDSGIVVHVCRSAESAVEITREWLGALPLMVLDPDKELHGAAPMRSSGVLTQPAPQKAVEAPSSSIAGPSDLRVVWWSGKQVVLTPVEGGYKVVRTATPEDLRTLPKGV